MRELIVDSFAGGGGASTGTPYAWFIWIVADRDRQTQLFWVPPGARQRLSRSDDIARFAGERAAG